MQVDLGTNYLGKRYTEGTILGNKYKDGQLEKKIESFKASLNCRDNESIEDNSYILMKLLKNLASYHQVRLTDIIAQLDESRELDISKLRFQLCNKTTIDRLVAELN